MRYLRFLDILLLLAICLRGADSLSAGDQLTALDITADQVGGKIHWGDLAVDDSDRVHVIWVSAELSSSRPGKSDHHLLYRFLDKRDSSLSPAVDLTQEACRVEGLPAIACNDRGQTAIVAYVYDSVNKSNGSVLWTMRATELVPDTVVRLGAGEKVRGHCGIADVAVADDGNIIVVYETPVIPDSAGELATTIWYEILDAEGQSLRPPTAVASGLYRYRRAANPCVAVNSNGLFAIAWNASLLGQQSMFPEQVFARVYDGTGSPVTDEILVSCEGPPGTCQGDTIVFRAGPAGKRPSIAISEAGEVAVVFRNTRYFECSNEYFVLRLLGPDGTSIGSMQRVNNVTECGASSFSAALAFDRDGRLLVTWANNNAEGKDDQSNRIYFQLFDKAGLRLGDNEGLSSDALVPDRDCDWRTSCGVSRNGSVVISMICGQANDSQRQLLLFLTSLAGLQGH